MIKQDRKDEKYAPNKVAKESKRIVDFCYGHVFLNMIPKIVKLLETLKPSEWEFQILEIQVESIDFIPILLLTAHRVKLKIAASKSITWI